MKVLLLGPERPTLAGRLIAGGDTVMRTEQPLAATDVADIDALVSFGYRHLLRRPILERFGARAVNLHISLLPWNRGADPNLWSFLEDTPKGVTVHVIDEGIDTGPVLAQRVVAPRADDTLASSYARLITAVEDLFVEIWPRLRVGAITATPQGPGGSRHRGADRQPYEALLANGWETPVAGLVGQARRVTDARI